MTTVERIPIGTMVTNRQTGQEMRIESYPMLKGQWTGEYGCLWYEMDVEDNYEYPRRKVFRPDEIILKV